jgi:uncharacterized Fe-S cluster-containing radical SAM superfamily protein
MHQLIASPFLDEYLIVHPGSGKGLRIGPALFQQLQEASESADVPAWLAEAVRSAWGLDVARLPLKPTVLVRPFVPDAYARASYEINKGCDYDCDHCYLGLKKFEGLAIPERMRLLEVMRDAGVLWLQITGGEPLIDVGFPQVYARANELGMMVAISSNGSRLSKPRILECFDQHRPYRITLSVYGATAETYNGFTRSKGAFGRFISGLDAARQAQLPVQLNIIVADTNAHELDAMKALADRYGFPHTVYTNMSPTIGGSANPLPTQATDFLRQRRPFQGCNAGHTFFHADPFGMASICKVGRDPQFDLIADGLGALRELGAVADSLQLRTGGCSGCQLSGTCWTCRPLAKLYQEAKAPLNTYCQHGGR